MHPSAMPDQGPPLPPVVGSSDLWEPTAGTFTCDRCGGEACTLTLLPPFARDPQAPLPGTAGALPGDGTIFGEAVRLSIDGPVKTTHTFVPGIQVDVAAVEAAIRTPDPAALFAIDREYAPFWCRQCEKSYCRDCWLVWIDYDEGFYDCTRGRCPEGHERIMDD
jgi:hypothetical protein